MEKFNDLDQVPLANLTPEQLNVLQSAEANLGQQGSQDEVYLIAFRKESSGS